MSRGCRTGPRPWRAPPAEVVEEVRGLLATLAPEIATDQRRDAATRLARLIRAEAHADGNLLTLTADDELALPLRERLAALTRRR